MDHLDWIEPAAKEIGAVNTIVIDADQLLGYNTDAAGFIDPLLQKFESLDGRRAAIISKCKKSFLVKCAGSEDPLVRAMRAWVLQSVKSPGPSSGPSRVTFRVPGTLYKWRVFQIGRDRAPTHGEGRHDARCQRASARRLDRSL